MNLKGGSSVPKENSTSIKNIQWFISRTTKKAYCDSGQIKRVDEFVNKHKFQPDNKAKDRNALFID